MEDVTNDTPGGVTFWGERRAVSNETPNYEFASNRARNGAVCAASIGLTRQNDNMATPVAASLRQTFDVTRDVYSGDGVACLLRRVTGVDACVVLSI